MPSEAQKRDICELNSEELSEILINEFSEKRFRATQIYEWLHKKKAADFSDMTNISKDLRERLSEAFRITVMEPVEILTSKKDGTKKYIMRLYDNNVIESVFMKYKHGNSVCISSQVGCRMGCSFCASTIDGLVRNLSAAEMLAQIYAIERDTGERVSNIVVMVSGEPLDNYDELVRFVRMISDDRGLNISQRNITVSTCGLVPRIRQLSEEGLQITLALSLHAPNQAVRERLMPVAKAYELSDVLKACEYYYEKTKRRLTFEYAVVKGVNDNREEALQLAKLIKGMHGHVNLIPVNPVKERSYESPDKKDVYEFQAVLESHGINATVRREMGRDIDGACGQLRRRYIENAGICTD